MTTTQLILVYLATGIVACTCLKVIWSAILQKPLKPELIKESKPEPQPMLNIWEHRGPLTVKRKWVWKNGNTRNAALIISAENSETGTWNAYSPNGVCIGSGCCRWKNDGVKEADNALITWTDIFMPDVEIINNWTEKCDEENNDR